MKGKPMTSSQHSEYSPQSSIQKPIRWLITGGCGFIGRNLIKSLLAKGNHVIRIVDNLSVGTRKGLSMVCSFVEVPPKALVTKDDKTNQLVIGDVLDKDLAMNAAHDVDVIVHLAANTGVAPSVENPRMDCEVNVQGTLNYLEAARHNKVNRFIFASSGSPVGECQPPIHEEMPAHPVSPYGASKLAGEGYCSAYFRTFGVETVALRFGNVYGPLSSHKSSVVAKFIRRAMEGENLEVYGDGSQTRDFIYVDDLVNAITLATEKANVGGEIFQIATSNETTISEIAQLICLEFEKRNIAKVRTIFAEPRKGDVKKNFSDTTKANEKLGWIPEKNLSEGLLITLDWFMEQNIL